MNGSIAGLALLALVSAACGRPVPPQVRYTETTPVRAQPRPAPAEVEILAMGHRPARAHERVGMLEVRVSQSYGADRQRMLTTLRERAAEAGCAAVVLLGPWYETVTSQPVYRRFVTESHPIFRAACIVYREPSAREPSGDAPR